MLKPLQNINSLSESLGQLWAHKGLLKYLIRLAMLAQYKKSFVGVLWLIVMPLINVVVWVTLSAGGVFNPGDTGIPYPAFVLLSTSIWQLFVTMFDQVSKSISSYSSVLVQAAFPREILAIEKVVVQLINFSIPLILNIAVLLYLDVPLGIGVLIFPLAILPLVLLGWGLGLIFSLIEIVAVDVYTIIHRIITSLLVFATPVIYTDRVESEILQSVMKYNPITHLLNGARDILLYNELSNPSAFFLVSAFTVVFFLLSYTFFVRAEKKIIEKIVI